MPQRDAHSATQSATCVQLHPPPRRTHTWALHAWFACATALERDLTQQRLAQLLAEISPYLRLANHLLLEVVAFVVVGAHAAQAAVAAARIQKVQLIVIPH